MAGLTGGETTLSERKRGRPRGGDRISYEEAARILGVTKYTIARWVADGYLPAYSTDAGYHKLWRSVVLELAHDRNKS